MLEAPITLLVICLILLIILQLGVWFHGYLVIHALSADLCRLVAVDDRISDELLVSYANDRMQVLGVGVARRVPGSLSVDVQGSKRERIAVTVSIEQQPLPLMRTISVGLVPATVVISGTSQTLGSHHNVEGDPAHAPYRYGNVVP